MSNATTRYRFPESKDSRFKRYVDQMQDPVEGRVTSLTEVKISQVLTGGDQRSYVLCRCTQIQDPGSRNLVGHVGEDEVVLSQEQTIRLIGEGGENSVGTEDGTVLG